ncbi:hypothetical protein IW261DRAFT_1425679 [Armillaria novae-zelandiae]|uniref:Uncharacterized protein n=1 Tax=Armillaria novae-zelandiae TaxID=153914 RepID=A0AA39NS42_9AGAR|nr:hypothetical protein IW261DRAFT_1425679 [Armillaria novae-zelandiae]
MILISSFKHYHGSRRSRRLGRRLDGTSRPSLPATGAPWHLPPLRVHMPMPILVSIAGSDFLASGAHAKRTSVDNKDDGRTYREVCVHGRLRTFESARSGGAVIQIGLQMSESVCTGSKNSIHHFSHPLARIPTPYMDREAMCLFSARAHEGKCRAGPSRQSDTASKNTSKMEKELWNETKENKAHREAVRDSTAHVQEGRDLGDSLVTEVVRSWLARYSMYNREEDEKKAHRQQSDVYYPFVLLGHCVTEYCPSLIVACKSTRIQQYFGEMGVTSKAQAYSHDIGPSFRPTSYQLPRRTASYKHHPGPLEIIIPTLLESLFRDCSRGCRIEVSQKDDDSGPGKSEGTWTFIVKKERRRHLKRTLGNEIQPWGLVYRPILMIVELQTRVEVSLEDMEAPGRERTDSLRGYGKDSLPG